MKNWKMILRNSLMYFIGFMIVEIVFRLSAGFDGYYMTFVRIALYNLCLSSILGVTTSYFDFKKMKWLCFGIVLVFAIYGFVELEFKNFLDNYYSFAAVSDGAGRISEYVIIFITDAKWYYWLTFISPIAILVFNILYKENIKADFEIKSFLLSIALAIIFFIGTFLSLNISNTAISLSETYRRFNNNDLLIDKLGLNHFLARDITCLFIEPDNSISLIIETPVPSETTKPNDKEEVLVIDDSRLISDSENETDENIKMIDEYILSLNKENTENEHTAEFKDYNFIYVLVESFDYMAIDPDLTPTLYKMLYGGYWFSNHYTPKYSCTTGESEFIANTSLVPYNDVCTPNAVPNNAYPEALAALFKNAGYDTYSFHNWYDQYYDRRELHASWGIDEYYNLDDLDIQIIQGWQSDVALVEESVPYFIDSDKFFSFIITSTTHWPYDQSSTLGDKYLNRINEVHPDYPIDVKRYLSKAMELDAAMARLLDLLEENGKLDNTIICLYSDHNPFKLYEDTIRQYSLLMDRYDAYAINKTPFFFYNPNLEAIEYKQVNSTFDQTPTIANLFGLNYDPRLYIGSDIFFDDSIVIFPNSDWITNDGVYITSNNTFIPFGDNSLSQSEIDKINNRVSNAFNISYAIMNNDYFRYREYLADPTYTTLE